MKRLLFIPVLIIAWVFALPVHAEEVSSFNAIIWVQKDASIKVEELIGYDFGAAEKHGIYRSIPIKYKARGGNFKLRLSDISVTDGPDQPVNFTTSYPGDNIEIKIGEADRTVTGTKFYKIKYTIRRAVNYFSDHDELYWNATGNGWQVPIKMAQAKIVLPEEMSTESLQAGCFAGASGSDQACQDMNIENFNGKARSAAFVQNGMNAGEGLTVVMGWPKGLVYEPKWWEKVWETFLDNLILLLPLAVFIWLMYHWRKRGRDPKGRGTIVAQFDSPDQSSPAEAGTLIDERAENKDVSAEIINLAVSGYLRIEREPKKGIFSGDNYIFHKSRDAAGLSNDFQKLLMDALFKDGKTSASTDDLKDKFYPDLKNIKDSIYASVTAKGYFLADPQKTRNIYSVSGIIIIVLGVLMAAIFSSFFGWLDGLSIGLCGLLVLIFAFAMPARTLKGVNAKEHIQGLKLYMSVAEKDRIDFHNAPAKDPKQFERLLPYAMVLGVETEWAKQFEGIYSQQPDWYSDPSHSTFNAILLANSLSSFQAHANSVVASQPSSASGGGSGFSGGFSGGGFGGGGGGSW